MDRKIELSLNLEGIRSAFTYVLVSACFRGVVKSCVFDANAAGALVPFGVALRTVQGCLCEQFPAALATRGPQTKEDEALSATDLGRRESRLSRALGARGGAYAVHYDTRLRLTPAAEGEWLRVQPEARVEGTEWSQTVLTFTQLAAEVQHALLTAYGADVSYGQAAELAFDALAECDLFDGQACLRLKFGRFGRVPFNTPVDTLEGAASQTQVLCRTPDKVVLVRVQRDGAFTLLASDPVAFAPGSLLKGTAEIRLVKSTLVCIFYSSRVGENVVYCFTRDGEVAQKSQSPFLDLSKLTGPAGTYQVEARVGELVAVSAQLQLNNFMQVIGLHGDGAQSGDANTDILWQSRVPGSFIRTGLNALQSLEGAEAPKKSEKPLKQKNVQENGVDEVLDFPIAEQLPNAQDVEKQLQLLEKQKQVEALREELAQVRALIEAEKEQQEAALRPPAPAAAPAPRYSVRTASGAQIEAYNRQYAAAEPAESSESPRAVEPAEPTQKKERPGPTAAEKLRRDSHAPRVRQTNAPAAHPLLNEPPQASQTQRLREAVARSNEAPVRGQGAISRATDRYAERTDPNVLVRGAPQRKGPRHRPAPIVGLDSQGVRAPPQQGRGAVIEGKDPDSQTPGQLKKPTFRPVVVSYVPDTARLRVDGLQQYQWTAVHDTRGLGPDENETKSWRDFKVPAPEDEYFA